MEQLKNAVSDIAGTLGFALVAGLVAAFYWWFSDSLYSGGIWTLGTLFRFVAVLAIIATAAGVIVGLIQIVLVLFRNPK